VHGPLLRIRLVRLAEQDHVLSIVLPHILTDGWSNGVLLSDLAAFYTAAVTGAGPDLPELPIQYPDYAAWQHDQVAGAALDAQLDYWRTQLAGIPTVDLPTDRPRPSVQTTRGASLEFTIPGDVAAGLRRLGRRHAAP